MDTPKNEEKLNEKNAEGGAARREQDPAQGQQPPKKKKNIIRVYHAQNASDGGRSRSKKPAGERRQRPAGAQQRPARPGAGPRPQAANPEAAPAPVKGTSAKPALKTGTAKPAPEKVAGKPAEETKVPARSAGKADPVVGKPVEKTEPVKEPVVTPAAVEDQALKTPAGKTEPAKAAAAKGEAAKSAPKAEKGKPQAPKAEEPKSSKNQAGKAQSGKDPVLKEEADKSQTASKAEEPKPEAPKAEEPKPVRRTLSNLFPDRPIKQPTASWPPKRPAALQSQAPLAPPITPADRRPASQKQTQGQRPASRRGDGGMSSARNPRAMSDTRMPRSQSGRPAGSGPGGQAGRGEGRPAASSRPGTRPGQGGGRRGEASFAPVDMGKSSKDSRRDRERENKNHKKDFEKAGQGQRRPGQGQRPGQKTGRSGAKPVFVPKEEKKPEIREITIPEKLTVRELAEAMKLQPSAIVKKLFLKGEMVTVNQELDFEKAQEIALEYDIIAEKEEQVDVIAELLKEEEEDESNMVPRPPVVCVMGHVDHGKTSLLDYIRNTHVTRGEAGGITQHIGAYVVDVNGEKITFLDTPGHEAFTAMRMRGANATDIAVLVVAADDGVMPQTVEAISHAKAAGVDIIVAINKIDKPSANIDKVKQELSDQGLIPEDWGGQTPMVPVSAHTGEGIDDLLEMIVLTAEVAELKADPNRAVRGLVIEAKLDKGKGPVATILVQKGTLRQGDFIAAGACSGKVRAMMDDKGNRLKEAGPSTPVEILGLGDVPNAGEVLMSFSNDKEAKAFAETFVSENKKHLLEETKGKLSLDNLFDQIQASDLKELPIIVKADVQGSVEAVRTSLTKLSNEEVVVKVIHGGVGAINESDVSLAATSNAIIIGFNVRPDNLAKQLAEQEGVDMRLYRVIYQAIEDIEAAMRGMLDPIFEEKVIGHAQVRQLFKASGVGTIAGSYILDGIFQRNCKVRLTREGEQVFEGELASLKRFKDDVKEVKAGYECGLVLKDFNDEKEDDLIEAYIMVEVPR